MNLPKDFKERMEKLLNEEYADFISSFNNDFHRGIRVNTLKISVDDYKKITPFKIKEVPWVKEGFFIDSDSRPGKHPYYHCGLYYIQEPSAMAPVEVLNPKPGDKVLDISAAPGGKATQIAAKLNGKGVLVANDISPKRVKALVKNIELFGIKNSVITNELPERLAGKFSTYFDKILVDAPCSGEGMFRKDSKAHKSWSSFSVKKCSKMQKEILEWVPKMLKPGGKLVYSTCTFSPEENEGTIEWFLNKFPEFEVEEIKLEGLDRGRPEWISARKEIENTARIWPHKSEGEGHFIALLRKKDGEEELQEKFKFNIGNFQSYIEFVDEHLKIELKENLHLLGSKLFMVPEGIPDVSGIRTAKLGLYLGEFKKNRFRPSQALAMALKKEQVKETIDLSSESIEAIKYLRGETLMVKKSKGWKLVCIDGFPVGWGKQTDSFLKNYYRAEWRMK
ncbi:RsmF rRNA methyltransferase first C-terminal domain-containing protein [Thermohalobacter berrensis]|uniref:SAM-dependent methyltransferase n=1 Tax=Thermohalobacter berrensis TaxID=99594 RepID=A0A419T239_9FIRM|nr:RsmF rRNA methyltransferase first C-terminal domain-containing protein [Thermohalobacter berrensis]RKD31557.1 SAM-dependent methyltransferase [Thermohalobacter berrensis]